MKLTKQKRKRGLILTPEGLQKLQSARLTAELNENYGNRYTFEDLSERIGINTATISKVLSREDGVDKRTIELFFQAFDIKQIKIAIPIQTNLSAKIGEKPLMYQFFMGAQKKQRH
jgi:cyanate lyase